MKSILFFLALALFMSPLAAQDNSDAWMRSYGSLEGFVIDSQYFTMVTDANLRDRPGTQSKVLTKLPIATSVRIVAVSEETYTQRGVILPWVKVLATMQDKTPMTGYLWGGFLALAHIQTPDEDYLPNRGVLYLTGVAAYDSTMHELTAQVRAAKDGVELAKTEFTTTGDLSYYPSFAVDYPPFKGVNTLLTVNYYYPACGYPSGNNLLFYQENGKLSKVLETSSVSDGGVFYSSEEMVMPTDKGGIGDHVMVVKDECQFEEKGDDLVVSKQAYSITLYKWTGTKLKKVKELK